MRGRQDQVRTITAAEFEANLDQVLDEIAATRQPCRIVHDGRAVLISLVPKRKKRRRVTRQAKP